MNVEDHCSFGGLALFFLSGVSSCQQWREVSTTVWGLHAKCMEHLSSGTCGSV